MHSSSLAWSHSGTIEHNTWGSNTSHDIWCGGAGSNGGGSNGPTNIFNDFYHSTTGTTNQVSSHGEWYGGAGSNGGGSNGATNLMQCSDGTCCCVSRLVSISYALQLVIPLLVRDRFLDRFLLSRKKRFMRNGHVQSVFLVSMRRRIPTLPAPMARWCSSPRIAVQTRRTQQNSARVPHHDTSAVMLVIVFVAAGLAEDLAWY